MTCSVQTESLVHDVTSPVLKCFLQPIKGGTGTFGPESEHSVLPTMGTTDDT